MDLLFVVAVGIFITNLYLNIEGTVWNRLISWLPDIPAVKNIMGLIPQSVPIHVTIANFGKAKNWVRGLSSPLQKKATSTATAVFVSSAALNGKRNTGIAKLNTGARRKYYINLSYPLMKGGA